MSRAGLVELIGRIIESAGVLVIFAGTVIASVAALRAVRRVEALSQVYRDYRQSIGRAILLGLELLVAGDIIRTVVVEPTLQSVGVLALIVAIRTFLSFSLQVEVDGRWPWQRPRSQGDRT